MSAVRCPDCSAAGANMRYDDSCPFAAALEAVINEDRDWFASRPTARVRHRRLTAIEQAEFRMFGFHCAAHMTHVRVTQLQPGLRARRPYERAA